MKNLFKFSLFPILKGIRHFLTPLFMKKRNLLPKAGISTVLILFTLLFSNVEIYAQDADNDGVLDSVDLDNDNDGILDTDENFCGDIDLDLSAITNAANSTVTNIPILNSLGVDSGVTYSGSITGGTSTEIDSPQGLASGSLRMGTVHSAGGDPSQFVEYTFTFSSPVLLNLKQAAQNGFFDEREDWIISTPDANLIVDAPFISNTVINDINDLDGDGNDDTGPELKEIVGSGTGMVSFTPNNLGGHINPSNSEWSIKSTGFISTLIVRYQDNSDATNGNQRGPINISLSCISIDTDNDGTPDYLDTDSDDDGCPDAIEAAGSFTSADLVADGSLGTTVDADGVPIIVNGGQATNAAVTLSLIHI